MRAAIPEGAPALDGGAPRAYVEDMGCLIGCLALAFPRVALALVWLLGPDAYLSSPFPAPVWPILGFIFLPTTTLAFAFATNSLDPVGGMSPFGWLLVIVALLIDLGLLGGGGRAARPRRDDDAAM